MAHVGNGSVTSKGHFKGIKWRIHKSFVPPTLIERVMLDILPKSSDVSKTKNDQCLMVDLVDINNLEEDDDWYII